MIFLFEFLGVGMIGMIIMVLIVFKEVFVFFDVIREYIKI